MNAQVTGLKFFEGLPFLAPGAPRQYAQSFARAATRYIYWEMSLVHPQPGSLTTLTIDAVFYGGDGSIFTQQTGGFTVAADAVASVHVKGTGFDLPGSWPVGAYRVDLWVEGTLVASATFQVTG